MTAVYTICQQASNEVYKLKTDNRIVEKQEFDPKDALSSISDPDGSTWVVEKVYSASTNTDGNNVHTTDGYAGAIYRNNKTNEMIVVNAGTKNTTDYVNDAQMALGNIPSQYGSARQIVQDAINISGCYKGGKVSTLTGHSLGGSFGQLQGVEFNIPAVTFNAYGVKELLTMNTSGSLGGQIGDAIGYAFNMLQYPDLLTAYQKEQSESQIINFKDSGDIIGNVSGGVGVDIAITGAGKSMFDTISQTLCLSLSDIMRLNASFLKEDLASILNPHYLYNFKLNGDALDLANKALSGGGINGNIKLSSTGMGVYDPLILDLDGDGIETVGLNGNVLFDHAADGTKNATGWVGKDDGLLVRDINNNGTIDTGRELFGDNTVLSNGQKAKNAYEALADLDSNKDGILNNQDSKYTELKIWQDTNQDGISQTNELKTLDEAGITSIKVTATNNTTTTLTNGNSQAASSTYTKTDGTTATTAGINFVGDEFIREFTTKVDTSKVSDLPDMHASGSVRDLREAAALSTDLATKLKTYANSTTRTSADLDTLVKTWANTSTMATLASTLKPGGHPVGARGTNLSQEEIYKLNVIEKFTGYYGGVANFKDPAADLANGRYSGTYLGIQLDAASINTSYDQLLRSVDTSIAVQTDLKEAMNDVLFKFSTTGLTVDFSNLYAKVNGNNPAQAVSDVARLYTYFKDTGGDLFPVANQTETLNWIKDRIVKDGIDPSQVNINFAQIGLATTGDDLIITSGKSSTIDGGAGNDQIIGLSGNDTLYGGTGNDSIRGGAGDDKIYGQDGNDTIDAGTGNDYVEAGSGDDSVSGGAGNDTLHLQDGNDNATGGDGNDNIYGGWGDDVIDGGAGNDIIYGNQGSNTLKGGSGDDVIFGSQSTGSNYGYWEGGGYRNYGIYDGANVIEGGTGNDTLYGGWKSDTYVFNKGDGKDTIIEQRKDADWNGTKYGYNDVIQFGAGIVQADVTFVRSGNDMVVNVGTDGTDSMTIKDWFINYDNRIEQFKFSDGSVLTQQSIINQLFNFTGTESADSVQGWEGRDNIDTGAGNDTISSYAGDDIINAGDGDDRVYAADGNDTIDAGTGNGV